MLIPCSVLDFSKHAPDHLLGCSCAIWPTWQRSDSASTRYGFPDLDGWKTRNCRTSALGVYARGLAQLSLLPSTIDPNSMSINDILLNVQKLAAMVEGHYKTTDQRALHCRCRDAPQMPPPYEKLVETCALIERRAMAVDCSQEADIFVCAASSIRSAPAKILRARQSTS